VEWNIIIFTEKVPFIVSLPKLASLLRAGVKRFPKSDFVKDEFDWLCCGLLVIEYFYG
jgi:hypothetical protein